MQAPGVKLLKNMFRIFIATIVFLSVVIKVNGMELNFKEIRLGKIKVQELNSININALNIVLEDFAIWCRENSESHCKGDEIVSYISINEELIYYELHSTDIVDKSGVYIFKEDDEGGMIPIAKGWNWHHESELEVIDIE